MTALESLEADMDELLERLVATGAQIFLATLPRPSLLPATETKRRQMIEAGKDPAPLIAAVDEHGLAANEALRQKAAAYPSVHIVDLEKLVADVESDGLEVAGQKLGVQKFGGLLGLDGVHFADTGYGFMANAFIGAINEALGTTVPLVPLGPVLAADIEAPAALAAAGLDAAACK